MMRAAITYGAGSLVCLLSFAPMSALADSCDYANMKSDVFANGPCQIERPESGYRLIIPGIKKAIAIKRGPHQGQFHRWILNGRNATFYELDRGSFCGTTDDLTENVCFSQFR